MIELSSSIGKLKEAWMVLQSHWEHTHSMWNDPVSARFEEEHLVPLEPLVMQFMQGTQRMNTQLVRAQQECSPAAEL